METSMSAPPLVVDLDGTLVATDTLAESVVKVIKSSPVNLVFLPFWLARGRAVFKSMVAGKVTLDVSSLPYRPGVVDYLREQKLIGRSIVLATAAHHSIAEPVARHTGLFDSVLATTTDCNLKGLAKLEAIRQQVGTSFVYAGDSIADLPIWRSASAAVLVNVSPNVRDALGIQTIIEREFPPDPASLADWGRALRVHQWLKNLLLFVPLLTAMSLFDLAKLSALLVAFLSLSLAASATYIVNDLWDLDNDRRHARKRFRPFASGRLPIAHGLVVAFAAMVTALALGAWVSPVFFGFLVIYVALTSLYSWALKGYVLLDVLMLSILYTLRILAGSAAITIPVSAWLLAFSLFIFLSLALVKRCAELVALEKTGGLSTKGRDYRITDLTVLWPMGVSSALSAVVVFGLFINAPDTQARYGTPILLWLIAIGLVYWLGRLWIKTSRGEMHDDPIVYALRDGGSRIVLACIVATMLVAYFLKLNLSI
ncbi:MAG TPA: UbiA family prenyltransferase [Aquabacterium sp.]|nr:UbiA family prenyltransferase [Aquabacterium sp.]HQC96923.1 UbiA family prenyltransferase [Aquabacterium sp.]